VTTFATEFLGCKVSMTDAQEIREELVAAGHAEVESARAPLRIVNTCCVTAEAVAKSRKAVRRAARTAERVFVTGCGANLQGAAFEDVAANVQMLATLRLRGMKIAIDDFGTGLSSLAYLKRIQGHELKIDKSLITDLTESQRDALIVRSTIDLAHSLSMKVTAEGVETANAFQLLAAMGCDSIQGYLIAKPQPLNELLIFLREDGATRSYG